MSSKRKIKDNNKEKIIELVFPENLLKSLNKIYEKQNQELMNAVSKEKNISTDVLLQFVYNQSTRIIKPTS